MSNTAFYKPPPKWHILAAFAAALLLEISAMALGDLRSRGLVKMEPRNAETYHAAEMILIETPPEPTPPPESAPSPPPPPTDASDFVITPPFPPLRVHRATFRVAPVPPIGTAHHTDPITSASAREKMLFAPRPTYPYEARAAKQTGSGRFLLRFDPRGNVAWVDIVQSTGSELLDQVSRSAMERWRCRPGVYTEVIVPVTFTLSGSSL